MRGIFDRRGEVVGWMGEEGVEITIYDLQGKPKAFLKRHAVYTFRGIYVGTFKRGYFRDKNGEAVAFIEGAVGDPQVPKAQIGKIPPKTFLIPRPQIKGKVPVSVHIKPGWSDITFEKFLEEDVSPECQF